RKLQPGHVALILFRRPDDLLLRRPLRRDELGDEEPRRNGVLEHPLAERDEVGRAVAAGEDDEDAEPAFGRPVHPFVTDEVVLFLAAPAGPLQLGRDVGGVVVIGRVTGRPYQTRREQGDGGSHGRSLPKEDAPPSYPIRANSASSRSISSSVP